MTDQHTIPEKLLIVALALEESGQTPFDRSLFVIKTWETYPDTFGLGAVDGKANKYSHLHPDSNKVLSPLMGERGLVDGRQWFRKAGDGVYQLTLAGRKEAMRVTGKLSGQAAQANGSSGVDAFHLPQPTDIALMHLSRNDEKWLRHRFAFSSDAGDYWESARLFWYFSLEDCVVEQLTAFRTRLVDLAVTIGDGETILPGGRSVTRKDVDGLIDLHGRLMKQYRRELAKCGKVVK